MSFFTFLNPYIALRIIIKNRTLLVQLVRRNVTARYKGSVLGLIWSFVQPLMMLAVYTFVFGFVFKARWGIEQFDDNNIPFSLIIFCGMTIFNIFSESVNTSASVITNNISYVKKVVFPLEILPFSTVITTLIFSLAWIILLFIGIILFVQKIHLVMFLLPITLFPLFLFTCGIAFLVSSLAVYLRDIQHVIGVITQILFFMTPILYPISIVPEKLQWILKYNPLSLIIEETRKIFLFGIQPDLKICIICFTVSYIVFQLGLIWFIKTKNGFADVL